jgi:hypothetical protein
VNKTTSDAADVADLAHDRVEDATAGSGVGA